MPLPSRPRLVLASTSPYRRDLLARLNIPFETVAPNVDESPVEGETPPQLALRLACTKAQTVQAAYPDALIIGCDQVALVANTLLAKPGHHDLAVQQLTLMSGQTVSFHTALCLFNARTARKQTSTALNTVHMRELSAEQIERYLRAEQPYDCAGSARIEGLGIALAARLEGDDPNALIGLPLINLCSMLRNEGIELP